MDSNNEIGAERATWTGPAFRRGVLLGIVLCMIVFAVGCTAPVVSRECSFAHPLRFSARSIDGLDEQDARELLAYNRTAREVCGG